jgi:hypothetical protein
MSITLSALMKQRYDTAANWTGQNPTLLAGEIGIESDTNKWKVGTGVASWTSLSYAIGGSYPFVNADVAAGAGIVDTKLATIATSGKVSNSATTAASANTPSAIVARDASGNFTASTITATLSGNASTVTTNANLTGDVTSIGNATAIASGVIVNADVSASAAISGSKIVAATTSVVGAVQLSDSTSTTSSTLAATPTAVKAAYDLANAALPKAGGTITGNIDNTATGYFDLPSGTTAQRPGSPNAGWTRFNTDTVQFEGYTGSLWSSIGGGAKGGGSDSVFFENDQTVTTNYTLTTNKNAVTAGPVTINSGVSVTIPSGSSWVVV